ncbi:cysteine desulfurase [Candidatus Woesearchaeota archaeon]|nr:cysteine desulfurase [Candidatus Woesearchaeota archaeon]
MKKTTYLDYAASTPLDPRVLKKMQSLILQNYANPSSIHSAGREARTIIEKSREKIASILHSKPEEIIFTSGGTESINLAIKGIAFQKSKGHIITSNIEHPAVLETCKYLENKGFSVTYIEADKYGLISPQKIEQAIHRDTILISIIYANNEIGTIQPIREIGRIAQKHNIIFHTDACQASQLDLNVERISVDLLTLNGSKMYGPKDVGILYKRYSVHINPLFHGGNQEFGLRSGTENVVGIVGFSKALELTIRSKGSEEKRLIKLRDFFIAEILKKIPCVTLNGHPKKRLANNISLSFANIEAEALLRYLDQYGIYLSTGSACNSNKIEQSHVLKAIAIPESSGVIRFTFGRETTKDELKYVITILQEVIPQLQSLK